MILGQVRAWGAISSGKAALASGDLEAAITWLEKASRVYPSSDEVSFLLAQAYRRSGDLPKARRELAHAQRLGWVKESVAFEELLLAVQSGSSSAAAVLEKALSSDYPEAARICEVLAPAALAPPRHDVLKAHGLVERWLSQEPDNPRAWAIKGQVAERLFRRKEAIDAYARALERRGAPREVHARLARLLLEEGRADEAGPQVEAALKASSGDPEARRAQAHYLALKGEHADARATLDDLLARAKGDPGLLYLRGLTELEAKEPAKALPFLEASARTSGHDPAVFLMLSRCLKELDRGRAASEAQDRARAIEANIEAFRQIASSALNDPARAELRRKGGQALLRLGLPVAGEAWLLSALSMAPEDGEAHAALAEHYARVASQAPSPAARDQARALAARHLAEAKKHLPKK
jgi:predicted Zn-dependent protease